MTPRLGLEDAAAFGALNAFSIGGGNYVARIGTRMRVRWQHRRNAKSKGYTKDKHSILHFDPPLFFNGNRLPQPTFSAEPQPNNLHPAPCQF
jgi:hypothetical protein